MGSIPVSGFPEFRNHAGEPTAPVKFPPKILLQILGTTLRVSMIPPIKFSPPLKWAGGKRWLIPVLKARFSEFRDRRLVEPFVGGMAVSLGLSPEKALLNDVNPHLINFYRHLQKGLKPTLHFANDQRVFLKHRARFNELTRQRKEFTREAAEIFYFLNRAGFNGLCRFNKKGEFNVPFGSYKKINFNQDFTPFRSRLKHWEFSCGDFEQLTITKGDFLYLDPPYDVQFTKYSKEGFTWSDQQRLVDWLTNFQVPMVVSNQATERVVSLYQKAGFNVELIPAPRRISSNGDRAKALEMLATKHV